MINNINHNNLSQIIKKYEVLFVDLWGVIHDGIELYPRVKESLIKIKESGVRVIFISNAPRRAFKAVEGLRRFGIEDHLYDAVITSGELVFEKLTNLKNGIIPNSNNLKNLGDNYIIIGPERDASLLDNTIYEKVNNIADSNFMVITGFDDDDSVIEEKMPYLYEGIKMNIPLICANPDLLIVRRNGKEVLCAGVLAKKYEEMGGRVVQYGKPYREIYEKAYAFIGEIKKSSIAAIGDNLQTDIKGANDFGIDSFLIPGGILARELCIEYGQLPSDGKLLSILASYNIWPSAILPCFEV